MRIVSPGHEEQGGPLAEAFLTRIDAPSEIKERVVPLVKHHLAHLQTVSDRSVRRLANFLKPATISELCLVMTADHFGRPPKPRVIHAGVTELRAKAEELRLRDSALSVPPSAPAQFSLLDNLKEFLEREDTFIDALSILRVLETKFELSDIAAEELEDIFKQVAQAKRQKSQGTDEVAYASTPRQCAMQGLMGDKRKSCKGCSQK